MKHYNEPDPARESFDYLTELIIDNSALTEEQARKIARALLSFADVLVDDE
jgi:hypothetical protein